MSERLGATLHYGLPSAGTDAWAAATLLQCGRWSPSVSLSYCYGSSVR